MQAIKTAYLGPTNVRGSRIKATCGAGAVILNWEHSLNSERNHMAAAQALIQKLGWNDYGRWIPGWVESKQDSYCVWVCDSADVLALAR